MMAPTVPWISASSQTTSPEFLQVFELVVAERCMAKSCEMEYQNQPSSFKVAT